MSFRDHLFYHELLGGNCSLADAVRTFEKIASERNLVSLKELRETADHQDQVDGAMTTTHSDAHFGALLMEAVFGKLTDSEIRDLINLAHKESLARQITLLLHTDDVKLGDVEDALAEFAELPVGESQVSQNLAVGIRVQLISSFISDNLFYVGVAKFHITMRDVDALLKRVVGKYGQRCRVGGKSAGTILANRILKPVFGEATGFEDRIEEVESYYLTAQVFNRFIEFNKLEEGHSLKYLDVEERESVREGLEVRFMRGSFPEDITNSIRELLEKLGEQPLIVRSSSLLEDSMGFPFYGKYESVFVSNQGSREERFAELLTAIKTVYVSILASSVIEYRKDKDLLDYEDMMSVLIQQVVGEQYGRYFFPATSGVAFSQNQYCWSPRMDPADGVARIVHGLGTRAVDRGGDDYPRLVALGQPQLRPEGALNEKLKYSQRYVDVLNIESRQLETIHFLDLYNYIQENGSSTYRPAHAISLIRDGRLESSGIYPTRLEPGAAAITLDGLLGNPGFPALLRGVLKLLEKAYEVPVDIEFACNGDKLYVLQCRPLSDPSTGQGEITIPEPGKNQQRLFETRRDVFRGATVPDIRYVVYVDGERYNALESEPEKLEVARTVGRVNRCLKGERFMIIGPGRWGSVNLDLGVKVSYGDINNSLILAEVALERGGYRPELSYGTHFFQDLVEADIIPLALFPGDKGSVNLEFLASAGNCISDVLPAEQMPQELVADTVRVIDLDTGGPGRLCVYLDSVAMRGAGILGV